METKELMGLLLDDKDAMIYGLRNELADVKATERKLWIVVARLQQAVGEANGWANVGELPDGGYDDFNANVEAANDLLGGIVSLTPAE